MKKIALVGLPNSGKSAFFNSLTGNRQKVANFPGVTVEIKKGKFDNYEICDYPGIYSLNPLTQDEQIAVDRFKEALEDKNVKVVACNLDVTRLERSLVFGLQAQKLAFEHKVPIVFVLNMMDEIQKRKVDDKNNYASSI